ncbi:hypothetical protein PVK06_004072 [Gossypium arboreum]|uniref:Reverse transcriptase zinc-binding domain-containing protein n=1 Tax=Gossypium arboreum TaxID=29729 RepID=A0ABR0QQZ1_GOSAR|nr:hypothetical protein PVK06_004072 [Gossypium arboreum]
MTSFAMFPLHIPKHSLIAWMVILNRLPTQDHVTKRRDYILFECSFSKKVWQSILRLCSIHRAVDIWRQELAWTILKLKGKSLLVAILKLAWSAYLYIKEIMWAHLGRRPINRTDPINASLYAS